mmetsp:Transcript_30355/g.75403  ORF Transcript_30355/g.75403 Transcript_30355/m.75403 type:complete len:434 (+) Transcript_30355:60-1361(+)|eukprot:CAMPEP_0197591652 /NCGR_PEP_ID=MMETSP1326-20131121/13834_1 /TAXON_ID=1155430 /ORGANISM="Genus nov. species nov., Strain RCC2288" /LENGTH=433 /DNA_ID=CAMNT_0043157191 /DNA_START=60 /DNA_END=1361 /DNA_ORIENTATION=-
MAAMMNACAMPSVSAVAGRVASSKANGVGATVRAAPIRVSSGLRVTAAATSAPASRGVRMSAASKTSASASAFTAASAFSAAVKQASARRSPAGRGAVKCNASGDAPAASADVGSSNNPIKKFFAKYPVAETVMYFAVWYYLNIQFNILNKQIYNYFPYPWFVSAIHLAVGLLIMTFFWTTKLVPFEKPDGPFLKAVTLPAFLHAFGHCLTNVSFATVAVSFTHTIKTLEPVFTAIGSFMVYGTVYAWPVYAALIPIMGGVAIASATELSFTWLGFSTAMASNVAFSARAIFSKNLMKKMSPLNLYNFVTIISLLFCIPFVFLFEGSTLAAGIAKAVELKGAEEFVWILLKVGAYYHLYNQVAYQALGKVEPVTHAVGNVGKRIFVIGFSILAFGNKISTQTLIGSAIAVAGAFLYGVLKAKYADQTKTLKRE